MSGKTAARLGQSVSDPNAKLHLYDKREARPGRKMGHFNLIGEEIEATLVSEAH